MNLSARVAKTLRYGAFGAIGGALALSPLGFAGADPNDVDAPRTPTTVTATVTAIVAPDQCEPLPDGKLPQKSVDYATTGGPITTESEAPVQDEKLDEKVAPATKTSVAEGDKTAAEAEQINGTGPFDPYLCDAQKATPSSSAAPTTPVVDQGPKLEDIPGVKPTLREYPGTGGGLAESPEGGSGVTLGTPDPKATPTENPERPGGLAPSRPLN